MSNKSLDGVLTKKAHQREKFTEEQIADLLPVQMKKLASKHLLKSFSLYNIL